MITVGIVILCIALYFMKLYAAAFWVIVFAIANGALGIIRAIVDPDRYANERLKAGLNVNLLRPERDIKVLIFRKIILIVILLFFAWKLGESAGYI